MAETVENPVSDEASVAVLERAQNVILERQKQIRDMYERPVVSLPVDILDDDLADMVNAGLPLDQASLTQIVRLLRQMVTKGEQ